MHIHIHLHHEPDQTLHQALQQTLTNTEILMGRAEEAQAALDTLTREVGEMKASAAGVVERLTNAKAAADALAVELQAKVNAGDTTLTSVTATATALAGQLDTAQAELDAIAQPAPAPEPAPEFPPAPPTE